MSIFYTLPARLVRPGVSTDDGQDVLEVQEFGDDVLITVYTPSSADDSYNRSTPETRVRRRDDMVELAVFPDTQVNLSHLPEARR